MIAQTYITFYTNKYTLSLLEMFLYPELNIELILRVIRSPKDRLLSTGKSFHSYKMSQVLQRPVKRT